MLRPDRLTLKAREAVQAALEQARTRGNPVVNDAHLLSALLAQDEGIVQPLLAKAGVSVPRLGNRVEARDRVVSQPAGQRRCHADARPDPVEGVRARRRRSPRNSAMRTSRPSTCCWPSQKRRAPPPASMLEGEGLTAEGAARCARRSPRVASRHRRDARTAVPVAGTLHPQPHRLGARRKARSGHRPRRGSAPGHAGAVAPHQEQSGADRRAGRRQDGDRRRAGAADRQRRRPRFAARARKSSRSTSASCWPAPSTAASSRSGSSRWSRS